jgi:NADH-quinone oxidoreductase subunit A
VATPVSITAYLALFALAGFAFVGVNLLVGRLLRPRRPGGEKDEVYECGEEVIGSSFVQFDIRFYVVALLFIIFDVEVAFFFPWAVVFGKATQATAAALTAAEAEAAGDAQAAAEAAQGAATRLAELGIPRVDPLSGAFDAAEVAEAARGLALGCFAEIVVFFAVLMVGFAYVWSRGDLDWVRTTINQPVSPSMAGAPTRAA